MPVPSPTPLVVKNGSKMRPRTSSGMPGPLSSTSSTTASPSGASRLRITMWSPCPDARIACSALMTRLSIDLGDLVGIGDDRRQPRREVAVDLRPLPTSP